MNKKLYHLLCCPYCKGKLSQAKNRLICEKCHKTYPFQDDIPDFSLVIQEEGVKLSQKKWNEKYRQDAKKNIIKELDFLDKKFFNSTWRQIEQYKKLTKGNIFLEIGCGTFYLGRHLAKHGQTVVGIDMSIEALKLAKHVFDKEKITNYLLVCGNILNMPFKTDSFDLLYGGGVLEHFKNTASSIKELQRVLKSGGVAYNTVPYLNIGSLTYRQIWGNIPRLPILEELFIFFHTRILKARHMRFGFELSFTRSYLEKIHKKAGFSSVYTGQFRGPLDFDYLKNRAVHRLAIYLAENNSFFWPMIYAAAEK